MAAQTNPSSLVGDKYVFSKPTDIIEFETLLFDMDGTIIDSTAAIVKHWHELGNEIGVPGDGELLSMQRHAADATQ